VSNPPLLYTVSQGLEQKKMLGESQPLWENTNDIPGNSWNQSKMELLYQKKEFVAGRMSGNEH